MAAHVLVVEDHELDGMLVRYLLAAAGHSSAVVASGREAVDAAKDQAPDLVLMDLRMPGADGYETLELMRREPELAGIPIVALTIVDSVEERSRAYEAGFDGFIAKPVVVEEFAAQLGPFVGPELDHRERPSRNGRGV